MALWNPWHGCHKLSEGCKYCYVYRGDARRGIDSSILTQTKNFDLPRRKNRKGEYKIPSGSQVYTCFTSDFFHEDADQWRDEAWEMIRERSDLHFLMITKRIDRFYSCIPKDWEKGYDNVTICCTVENQDRTDYRLPIYKQAPIKHKIIICEPLLEKVDLRPYLDSDIEQVVVGGESGNEARICDYDWILDIRHSCIEKNISFWFKQTGSRFIKDGQLYKIARQFQHSQARKSGLNTFTDSNNNSKMTLQKK
ncbi:phage Gp37/Gp68 family protein [Dysgonomonas sp. OttesenSCG-928-M03]|nr:phage Gp37/Gp68 family protein [Dysgonomonas sp. OttesenSCG-928-M03]